MLYNNGQEFQALYRVEDLGAEYEREHGLAPFNISYWNPSTQMERMLLSHLNLPRPSFQIPYIYSYYEGKDETLRRLGFTCDTRRCWFINAGTIAVLLAVRWLAAQDIDRVVVLCPTYFSVLHLCEAMKLPLGLLHMQRVGGCWQLPKEEIMAAIKNASHKTALWLTNPVFSTGCYISEPDRAFLTSVLEKGTIVVADECLALNGYEIGRTLGGFERFMGLYSPHKSVSVNATKFASIVFDKKYQDFFRGWGDVMSGPLASSTYSAIIHFLGDDFHRFQTIFLNHVDSVREEIAAIVSRRPGVVEVDEHSMGHYIMFYVPRVQAGCGEDEKFMRDLIWSTGATLVAGIRSHMNTDLGFNFRINLARECPQFYSAFHRIIEYLVRS